MADGRRRYVSGNTLTLADLALYCRFSFFVKRDKQQAGIAEGLPHVAAYMARVAALPSAKVIQKKKKAKAKAKL